MQRDLPVWLWAHGTRRGVALALAALWACFLVGLAISCPIGPSESSGVFDAAGHQLSAASTTEVFVPVYIAVIPLIVVLFSWALLAQHRRAAGAVAWTTAAAAGLISLLGILTIGPLFLPLAVTLTVAAINDRPVTR